MLSIVEMLKDKNYKAIAQAIANMTIKQFEKFYNLTYDENLTDELFTVMWEHYKHRDDKMAFWQAHDELA